MTRGQRAARPAKFGAWQLTGVIASGYLYAIYERPALHMQPDGTWRPSVEIKRISLTASINRAAIPADDFNAMSQAFTALSRRLLDLAAKHQTPPENE